METLFLETISDCENVNRTNVNSVAVTFISLEIRQLQRLHTKCETLNSGGNVVELLHFIRAFRGNFPGYT